MIIIGIVRLDYVTKSKAFIISINLKEKKKCLNAQIYLELCYKIKFLEIKNVGITIVITTVMIK